jgi:hypothetical protein
MDILKEVKSLLGIELDEGCLYHYFYVDENQYCIWIGVEYMNLYNVEDFSTEDVVFELDVYTTLKTLSEEEYLFLSISEGTKYMTHQEFLETLSSLFQ